MPLTIATWNVNSVRLRINQVTRLLRQQSPDILCLQEIKCRDDMFPAKAIRAAGYEHIAVHGQAGYHGVAIVSRVAFLDITRRRFCASDEARHIAVEIGGEQAGRSLWLHNFYVPAGGDVPDAAVNAKFAHKLQFLREMEAWLADENTMGGKPGVLVGDLNIAPLEHDVWSHKQLARVVSHTPIEVEHLDSVQRSRRWVDIMRRFTPADQKLFTWWSYRARDWRAANKGRRLDHIWATPDISGDFSAIRVLDRVRGWEKPSDHCPVIGALAF